jgi:hypothetical protein
LFGWEFSKGKCFGGWESSKGKCFGGWEFSKGKCFGGWEFFWWMGIFQRELCLVNENFPTNIIYLVDGNFPCLVDRNSPKAFVWWIRI